MRWVAMVLGVASPGMAQAPCDLTAATSGAAGASCERAWMDANPRLNGPQIDRVASVRPGD